VCHIATASERWSRQLEPGQIFNDWVPISQDAKSGKSLSFGDDLVPAAQTPFQFFAEPLNNRFNLQQQHPAHPSHTGQPAEVNSFISNNVPQFQFLNSPSPVQKQRTVQNFGGSIGNKPVSEPLIQNAPQNSPFTFMQEVQRQPHVVHYQSQPINKNVQNSFIQQPPVPAFQFNQQSPRVPHYQKFPSPQFQSFPQQQQILQQAPVQQQQQQQEQPADGDSQLLYVPFDSLYPQNQPQSVFDKQNRYNILSQPPSASLINDFYSPIEDIPNQISTKQPVTTKRPTITPPTASYKLTTPFETTSKLKPHQPPLSMFVANDNGKASTEADVLSTLKNSNTIDVMDSVVEKSPRVFIGPSGMSAPNGYTKFELPYLSSIDGTRNDRKIDQLPFFVAPLSYKTPPGFSKIPLPAPHVGSVVVNQPANSIESNESSGFTPDNYYTKQPSFTASPGPINNFHESPKNKNVKNSQTVKLTSGFHFTSDGNVQLISNEFTFPTLSPSTTLPPPRAIENKHKAIFTTPKPTFVQSSITPSNTPLTKVKANYIQELRTNEYATHTPTTPRVPVATRTRYDEFGSSPSSIVRTSARTPTTYAPIELDEHRTINDDYYKFKSRPTVSSFEYQEKKTKKTDFNFKPIPEFNFESVTSKKPKIKTTTSTTTPLPPTTTTKEPIEVAFHSTSPLPSPTFDYTPTVSAIENTDIFKQIRGDSDFSRHHSTPRPSSHSNYFDVDGHVYHPIDTVSPQSHSISQFDQFFNTNNNDENVPATENPNYNLPSELPPINAHLPGLVNSLMEEKWIHKNLTEEEPITTTTTKRPRGRRPTAAAQSTYRTASSDERKPVTRGRRPSTYSSRATVSATESTIPSRTSPSRSSKIRYNITSTDDLSRFRTRQNKRPVKKEEQNIEYQRDVLNQNYPSSVRPPTTVSTEQIVESIHIHTEVPATGHVNDYNAPIESVEVIPLGGNIPTYTNDQNENVYTPDNPLYYENTIDTTVSTTPPTTTHRSKNHRYSNEEYQLPQHKTVSHRLKGNFNFNRNIDAFYNKDSTTTPHEDEVLITAPITTSEAPKIQTTTTEAPETEAPVTRRTNFPRRRLYTTTPQPEQQYEPETTESYAVSLKAHVLKS
jgi:hypothetical protein